jgi:hypothetical protein
MAMAARSFTQHHRVGRGKQGRSKLWPWRRASRASARDSLRRAQLVCERGGDGCGVTTGQHDGGTPSVPLMPGVELSMAEKRVQPEPLVVALICLGTRRWSRTPCPVYRGRGERAALGAIREPRRGRRRAAPLARLPPERRAALAPAMAAAGLPRLTVPRRGHRRGRRGRPLPRPWRRSAWAKVTPHTLGKSSSSPSPRP